VAQVRRLDERLNRVEKRLDDLVVFQPVHALQADVRDLRARLDAVEAQVTPLGQAQP
jgi:hypothetical protein